MDLIEEYKIPSKYDVPETSNLYPVFKMLNDKLEKLVDEDNLKGIKELMLLTIECKAGIDEAFEKGDVAQLDLVEVEDRYMTLTLIRVNSYLQYYLNNLGVDHMKDIETQYKRELELKRYS